MKKYVECSAFLKLLYLKYKEGVSMIIIVVSGTITYKLVKEKIWSTNQMTIFMNTILTLCII